jgi:hypothetical protein
MIKCAKCGNLFDPSTQAAQCRGRGDPLRHYQTKKIEGLIVRVEQKKPAPRRKPFQSDFRLLWDEPEGAVRW